MELNAGASINYSASAFYLRRAHELFSTENASSTHVQQHIPCGMNNLYITQRQASHGHIVHGTRKIQMMISSRSIPVHNAATSDFMDTSAFNFKR